MPPETHFFEKFLPALPRRRLRFPLTGRDLEAAVGRFLSMETSRGMRITVDDVVAEAGGSCRGPFDLFAAIVRALAGPAVVYGEKTPNHLLWWRYLHGAAPWMQFIGVVRDPRAVAASYRRTWQLEHCLVTAHRWRADQRLMREMARVLGSRVLLLQYETMVARPDDTRERIAEFIGMGRVSALRKERNELQLGLPWETWKVRASARITTESVGSWKRDLSARETVAIERICRTEMKRFGYEPGASPRVVTSRLPERLQFVWRRRVKYRAIQRIGA